MELPRDGTFCQRMMPHEMMKGIQWVHREQGPEIITLRLQDMYIHLGFSPKAAKLLITEQGFDSPERLRALINNNFDVIYNVCEEAMGQECGWDAQQRATGLCHSPRELEACHLPIPS